MTTLSISQLRADLAEAINRVAYRKERVIVERQGKRLAVIVPVEELEMLEELEDEYWGRLADRALREPGADISLEDIKREFDLA
jgi:prevent-host-death family protein